MPQYGAGPSGPPAGLAGACGVGLGPVAVWKGSERDQTAGRHLSMGEEEEQAGNWSGHGRCQSCFWLLWDLGHLYALLSLPWGWASLPLSLHSFPGAGAVSLLQLCQVTSIALSSRPPPFFLNVFWHFLKPCLLCWATACPFLPVLCSPVQQDWGYHGTPSKDATQHSVLPHSIRLIIICVAWCSGTGNSYWAMNITVKIITTNNNNNNNNAICPKVAVPAQTGLYGNPYQESAQSPVERGKKKKKKHLMLELISLGRMRNSQKRTHCNAQHVVLQQSRRGVSREPRASQFLSSELASNAPLSFCGFHLRVLAMLCMMNVQTIRTNSCILHVLSEESIFLPRCCVDWCIHH